MSVSRARDDSSESWSEKVSVSRARDDHFERVFQRSDLSSSRHGDHMKDFRIKTKATGAALEFIIRLCVIEQPGRERAGEGVRGRRATIDKAILAL